MQPSVPAFRLTARTRRAARPALASLVVACLLTPAGAVLGADLRARVFDQNGRGVSDAVVAARPLKSAGAAQAAPRDEAVEQIDQEFAPHVKAVLAGSRVHFPNRDKVQHQVYSFSPAKRFELPLYSGTSASPITFDKPGVVTLGCNIHDWMIGYIYVADTPYFGTTGKDGVALLKDVPAGEYDVRVWQPGMTEPEESTVRRVTVGRAGVNDAEWRIAVKPAFKVRRAPGPGRGGYR